MRSVVVALAVDASILFAIDGITLVGDICVGIVVNGGERCRVVIEFNVIVVDDTRENFGDRGSLTCMYGGDIGRMKFAIDAAGDVERLRLIGDVDDELAADESILNGVRRRE
jgi:hypothetical protein